ncbi:MAG: hypothetical protein LQ343_002293 [Gyalolechia ehrenbergii]|nr:MAG: hypothetical protein LQ343_002293 [Gyalolechia ehrenbergii]
MAGQGPAPPMSVEQIVLQAENFEYNPLVPFRHWSRSAGTLLKEADIYESEGNDQQAYLLLFRHARLVLDNLPTHPEARSGENESALQQLRKDVLRNFTRLETLKPRINRRYSQYQWILKERSQAKAANNRAALLSPRGSENSADKRGHSRLPSDPALSNELPETLTAGENRDLAVQLAHKEIRRRATARKATRQAGISEEEEHERRTAGLWGDWEEALSKNDQNIDRDLLSRQMHNIRLQVNGTKDDIPRHASSRASPESNEAHYQYPSVPQRITHDQSALALRMNSDTSREVAAPMLQPPLRPPKDLDLGTDSQALPPRPSKENISRTQSPDQSSTPSLAQQSSKPTTFTFKPSAYLENGTPLRTIFLPPDLRHRFLSIALPNTKANLETCGILCGTLISNALFISKLVIPEQESTSDTCETVNESDLFDYVDGEDLMVLGWIHTHPTQTCFMSSRDLHTHCGYQVMMSESIAIVCAPSKGDWGVFRLTDPPGMKSVLNCTQSGLFHPHAESNIYTDALRPGHVYEARGLEFDVVDLRPAS